MKLWTVLNTRIPGPRLPYGWPLVFLAAPAFVALFLAIGQMTQSLTPGEYPAGGGVLYHFSTNWRLPWFCLFLGRQSTTWVVAAVWLAVDVFLIAWVGRAWRKGSEPARPALLFFTWQGAKFALFLLYLAVAFLHGPLEPYLHVLLSPPGLASPEIGSVGAEQFCYAAGL